MNDTYLIHVIEQQSVLLKAPVALYEGHTCIASSAPRAFRMPLAELFRERLGDASMRPVYYISSNLLLIGKVKDTASNMDIYVGPICSALPETQFVRELVTAHASKLTSDDLPSLLHCLKGIGIYSFEQFVAMLSCLDSMLNRRVTSPDTIIGAIEEGAMDRPFRQKEQNHVNEEVPHQSDYLFEDQMLFYVEHGMVEECRRVRFTGYVHGLASSEVRHYKNALIVLNSICLRAAIKGGYDPDSSYQMGEIIIQQIEACQNIEQIINLNQKEAIPVLYATKVRDAQYPKTDSVKVNEALSYIRKHYYENIGVADIASVIHVSSDYLSTLFKQEMKITMTQYIQNMKIAQAKALLLYTDMPLSSIAVMLSFSSQSHFQTVFKKTAGTTPIKYRNEFAKK